MGNYRFRLSDMMPNAWFYKLKDMNRLRNHHKIMANKQSSSSSVLSSSSLSSVPQQNHPSDEKHTKQLPHLTEQRKSYYITRDLNLKQDNNSVVPTTEPPRKSSRRRRSTKKIRRPEKPTGPRLVSSSSVSAGCSCKATMESVWTKPGPDFTPEDDASGSSSEPDSVLTECGSDRGLTPDTFDGRLSWSSSCKCRTEKDIVIDMVDDDNKTFNDLPPIITKKNDDDESTKIKRTSTEFSYGSLSVKVVKENFLSTAAAKPAASPAVCRRIYSGNSSSPGMKLRTNSPRILNRKIQGGRKSCTGGGGPRRSLSSESFAVVKSSKDPRRDFRESMVEMILENNIRASKDLEELLACYLSLNSDEYHDIIINVFKQIWFDFIHLRAK